MPEKQQVFATKDEDCNSKYDEKAAKQMGEERSTEVIRAQDKLHAELQERLAAHLLDVDRWEGILHKSGINSVEELQGSGEDDREALKQHCLDENERGQLKALLEFKTRRHEGGRDAETSDHSGNAEMIEKPVDLDWSCGLLDLLGLREFYPNKITLNDVMRTVDCAEPNPSDASELPWLLLRGLITQDSRVRDQ